MAVYGSVQGTIFVGPGMVNCRWFGKYQYELNQPDAAGALLPGWIYDCAGHIVLVGLHQRSSCDELSIHSCSRPKKPDDLSYDPDWTEGISFEDYNAIHKYF